MHISGHEILTDENLQDGVLQGYTASGKLIVSLIYMPNFKRTVGTADDEDRVAVWKTSPGGVRRIAAISAWKSMGDYITAGSA